MRKDILKVVIIGDGGVGKTSIRVQYIHRRFTSNYKATIGADFITKDVQLEDGKKVSMQIWDTAGQERFQSLGIAYYRGADACIIVFDVTNPDSFNHVLNWEHEFIDKADLKDPSTYPFILIGNKIDNEKERRISRSQGRRMAIKMRKQSIKEAPHYGLIQQSKYSPTDNIQSYNDSLLAIYQRSSSYKRYHYALQNSSNTDTNNNTNNNSNKNNNNNNNNNNRNNYSINKNNNNMLNTENIEGLTSYNNYKKKNHNIYTSYGNGSNINDLDNNYDDDGDSIDYEDYDDLESYRIPYFEVSAKYGDNIEDAFHHIAKTVQLPQFEFLIEGDTINWDDEISRSNKCCF